MKLLLLATFVLACSAASLFGGKRITIEEDGSIIITGTNGKKVMITKETSFNGPNHIVINVSGPNFPTKRIVVNDDEGQMGHEYQKTWDSDVDDENRYKRQLITKQVKYSQIQTLATVLKEYQGTVDDITYAKLLKQVFKLVQLGEINAVIYEILENLDSGDFIVPVRPFGQERVLQNLIQSPLGLKGVSVFPWHLLQRGGNIWQQPLLLNHLLQQQSPLVQALNYQTTPFMDYQRYVDPASIGDVVTNQVLDDIDVVQPYSSNLVPSLAYQTYPGSYKLKYLENAQQAMIGDALFRSILHGYGGGRPFFHVGRGGVPLNLDALRYQQVFY